MRLDLKPILTNLSRIQMQIQSNLMKSGPNPSSYQINLINESIPGHARHAVGRRVGVLGAAQGGRRGRPSADVVRRRVRRVRGGRRLLLR